jgi:hypothetical protein
MLQMARHKQMRVGEEEEGLELQLLQLSWVQFTRGTSQPADTIVIFAPTHITFR